MKGRTGFILGGIVYSLFPLLSWGDALSYQRDPFLAKTDETHQEIDQVSVQELETRFFDVRYANVEHLSQLIIGSHSLLSERGSVQTDERTNILVVRGEPSQLNEIERIIHRLDVPIKQVEIEARIAIVNEGNLEELGVRWGLWSSSNHLSTAGTLEELNPISTEEGDEGSIEDFLNINLGASSPQASSIAFRVAKLGGSGMLDLELSALQAESKAEVISSPRLMTTSNESAYIEQGTEIPYLESSESGVATVKFRKAVLSLKVTPKITADNKLVLALLITQDRPGQLVSTGEGEAIAIDTQRIETQVLVNNGETIALGGIYQHSVMSSVDKVPLLSDIPFLGNLFKKQYENEEKRELVIFVTPTIQ